VVVPAENFSASSSLSILATSGRRFSTFSTAARASRGFLTRSIRYLAEDAGIRQFLDIGTGLPTADNTHQVAQRIAPEARVVYVDNDPMVLAHARALLTSTKPRSTGPIEVLSGVST